MAYEDPRKRGPEVTLCCGFSEVPRKVSTIQSQHPHALYWLLLLKCDEYLTEQLTKRDGLFCLGASEGSGGGVQQVAEPSCLCHRHQEAEAGGCLCSLLGSCPPLILSRPSAHAICHPHLRRNFPLSELLPGTTFAGTPGGVRPSHPDSNPAKPIMMITHHMTPLFHAQTMACASLISSRSNNACVEQPSSPCISWL